MTSQVGHITYHHPHLYVAQTLIPPTWLDDAGHEKEREIVNVLKALKNKNLELFFFSFFNCLTSLALLCWLNGSCFLFWLNECQHCFLFLDELSIVFCEAKMNTNIYCIPLL